MKNILFNTYKIAHRINLVVLSKFFSLRNPVSWKDYIRIDGDELESVLKYNPGDKKVYIFKYGCITFVNYNSSEMYAFLDLLQSIIGKIDYNLHSKYNENHVIKFSDNNHHILWADKDINTEETRNLDDIISIILAKSTELSMIEAELTKLLDESEIFITYLQKGNLRAEIRKVTAALSGIIKFKYMGIESIKVLERPGEVDNNIASRNLYDEISAYYELEDRYDIIKEQMKTLQSITEEYFKLGKSKSERRLVGFEVFLLVLFPLFHLLQHVFRF